MPVAQFSFGSFGDIVAIAQLVVYICTVLRGVDGAGDDIRCVIDDLELFQRTLTEMHGSLAVLCAGLSPEQGALIEDAVRVSRTVRDSIRGRVMSGQSKFQKSWRQRVKLRLSRNVAWELLGGRELVAADGARLNEKLAVIRTCLLLAQSVCSLQSTMNETRTQIAQLSLVVQNIPIHIRSDIFSFQFYDTRSSSYYQPCAFMTMERMKLFRIAMLDWVAQLFMDGDIQREMITRDSAVLTYSFALAYIIIASATFFFRRDQFDIIHVALGIAPSQSFPYKGLIQQIINRISRRSHAQGAHQVSGTWRSVALSDCRLWDSFSCSKFRDERHQDAMLDQLQTMLLRSRALPFRLRIPHRYRGGTSTDYCRRLLELEQMDIRRLSLYGGPADIFDYINLKRLPLPALIALDVHDPTEPKATWYGIMVEDAFSPRCLPNLQELSAFGVAFPDDSAGLQVLRSLTCSVNYQGLYQRLFDCCPNVVRVQLNDINFGTRFLTIKLPPSLETLILRPKRTGDLNVYWLLQTWTGVRIPRLVMHPARSLRGVLQLFLASHSHPVELRLNAADHELALVSLPDRTDVWTLTPSPRSDSEFLEGLETSACERLTSISVAMGQLGRLFVSQLHVPALEQLEFRLNGAQAFPLLQSDADFFVRAPRLRRVIFNANGSTDAISAHMEDIYGVLDVLRASFRALLVYDAEFLDSIMLHAPEACVQPMDCADFAHFSHEYIVCVDVKNPAPY
ncbi:hypothetical protein AURDEDRAFT_186929 [Auricularia subglabra TFB-10046 SS5]|nr:hypothetical protein AURDEDRAFT_186929 [Auricularia subglabra TFB-10046 SS5]